MSCLVYLTVQNFSRASGVVQCHERFFTWTRRMNWINSKLFSLNSILFFSIHWTTTSRTDCKHDRWPTLLMTFWISGSFTNILMSLCLMKSTMSLMWMRKRSVGPTQCLVEHCYWHWLGVFLLIRLQHVEFGLPGNILSILVTFQTLIIDFFSRVFYELPYQRPWWNQGSWPHYSSPHRRLSKCGWGNVGAALNSYLHYGTLAGWGSAVYCIQEKWLFVTSASSQIHWLYER